MKNQQTYDVLFTFTQDGRSGMTYNATVEATDIHNAVMNATFILINLYEIEYEDGFIYLGIQDIRVDSVTLIDEPK